MEAKHTPGPWKDGPVFQRQGRAIFLTDTSKGGRWNRRLDEGGVFGKADARLIAAAPELLQAALDFVEFAKRSGWDVKPGSPVGNAVDAIARATQ